MSVPVARYSYKLWLDPGVRSTRWTPGTWTCCSSTSGRASPKGLPPKASLSLLRVAPSKRHHQRSGSWCYSYGVDTRTEAGGVEDFIASVDSEHGPIEFALYNPGANVLFDIAATTARAFLKCGRWRALAAFCSQRPCLCAWQSGKEDASCFLAPQLQGKNGFSASVR